MGIEIERKFLVDNNDMLLSTPHRCYIIHQYYIDDNTRIRFKEHSDGSKKACMTIKHENRPVIRNEWEFEIDFMEAADYVSFLKHNKIGLGHVVKTRHLFPSHGLTWEVDVFHEKNEGLILAEIELPHEDFEPHMLDGLGKEVTNDEKYYNSYLAKNPYKNWSKEK